MPRNFPPPAPFSIHCTGWRHEMGKGLILWLLGVPGIVVIGLLLFNVI
ncbi:hypothetical protein L6Q21_04295 [Sandaracinobacter sp. RS1-74]|nr:hypothetical protein [Sandaracinobacteroides sayramensis]MCG2840201.1 hypothetical protein [Sandaracinobacteroides sayramensis]